MFPFNGFIEWFSTCFSNNFFDSSKDSADSSSMDGNTNFRVIFQQLIKHKAKTQIAFQYHFF